jgi:Uma2 family endonuclease
MASPQARGGTTMHTVLTPPIAWRNGYPTSDGKPMAETDWHRIVMTDTIETLEDRYTGDPRTYVSGNILVYYEPDNKRRHVSPDVLVVRDIEKRVRPNYLVWEEGKGPDVVIEITSSSTRQEDQDDKFALYRDVLKVREYFLFDPFGDYLDPPLQGYRLRGGKYVRIRPRQGRLPSQVLGLHLERDGDRLRLWGSVTQAWLPTRREAREQAEQRAAQQAQKAEQAEQRAKQQAQRADQAEAEIERLRRELDRLREQTGEQD